ncbi:CI-B8 domain-containing protein, partial [Pyronema omphalodes]
RLALVRNGVGAAILPKDVSKLVLTYSFKGNDGHLGPRKFWRQYLPRLKFHNPDVPMEVIQKKDVGGPATLVIEFKGDRKETIDVQHRHESDIIKEVLQITNAKQLPINPEDNKLANEY